MPVYKQVEAVLVNLIFCVAIVWDDATYIIEKETPGQLVISYKQNPNPSDKDAAFMKDCRMYMTINLKTKKVEQVQAINEKPLKIKMLNAEKFDLTIKIQLERTGRTVFHYRRKFGYDG